MTKNNRLIFLRHGIRGFPEPKIPVSPDPACLLLIASEENLSLHGHRLCNQMGKFIRLRYGCPNFIYGDVSTPRTIDSSISLGLGAGINKIHLSTQDPDPFYQTPNTVTPESIAAANQILTISEPVINEIKITAEKLQPCLQLSNTSDINPVTGAVEGLVLQEYVLGSIMLFSEDSGFKNPLLRRRDLIAKIETILWNLRTPTLNAIRVPAEILLTGVSLFLQQFELSVLVGHEHNIIQLSKLIGIPYKLPNFPELWVQPMSGFVFTLHNHYIQIEIIFLTSRSEHKFEVIKYAKISIPIAAGTFDLITKTINY